MYAALRALLFRLEAERAHRLAVAALRGLEPAPLAAALRARTLADDPRLAIGVLGLRFPSPLGLAAGFDKGEGLAGALFALGFGFVEMGTVTPRPQAGNPRPRLFRLPRHRALVNRMGFNNPGAGRAAEHLRRVRFRPGPVGVNLGKNKDTPQERAVDDYLAVLAAMHELGDYFVINVSSPNTPGLRDLQRSAALAPIVRAVVGGAGGKPVLVKLAPDLADEEVGELAALARDEGAAGLVLANTTVRRDLVADEPRAAEAGGLSGPPLRQRALELVRRVHREHGTALPLVGVGGVESPAHLVALLRAGASLVQGYTGFVYGGPGWADEVLRGVLKILERERVTNVADLVGRDARS